MPPVGASVGLNHGARQQNGVMGTGRRPPYANGEGLQLGRSGPTQLLQRHAGVPNLRHVAYLVPRELHHINVVRSRLLAGRFTRTTGTSMSTRKNRIGSDVVSFSISSK